MLNVPHTEYSQCQLSYEGPDCSRAQKVEITFFGKYLSAADAMKRNLEARVEVLCPIEAPALC
jgi:hypothetical protein